MNIPPLSTRESAEIATALGEDIHRFASSTVLLTGGCGFLGQHFQSFFSYINSQLLERPCHVIVLDNLITGRATTNQQNGVTVVTANVIERLIVDEPIDYVIHAAGIASPFYYRKFPLETLEVATLGTKNVLRLAAEMQVKSMIFFSSSEIYGDPDPRHVPTPESYRGNVAPLGPRACYDESKRLGETLCYIFHNMHGVNVKIVRPFNIYGPGMVQIDYRVLPNWISRILNDQPLHIYGNGLQTRTFCYVSDGIAGVIKALLLGVPGEAYNIGNDHPEISMLDLADIIGRLVGGPLKVDLIEYPDAYPPDEPMRRCPDLTKARTQLEYKPAIQLEDGLQRFIGWASVHYERAEMYERAEI